MDTPSKHHSIAKRGGPTFTAQKHKRLAQKTTRTRTTNDLMHLVWRQGLMSRQGVSSQRSLHNAPIFRLLLKVAVNGTHQCDYSNFCGSPGSQRSKRNVASRRLLPNHQRASWNQGVATLLKEQTWPQLRDATSKNAHYCSEAILLARPPSLRDCTCTGSLL